MSFTNGTENSVLALMFNATAWANIADNASSSPATNLYLSLHTADPGEAGSQTTSEIAYTSYARVAVARTTGGWTAPSGGATFLVANADFPACTGSSGTATYMGIGLSSSGAGTLQGSGPITPNIAVSTGVTPRLTTATTVTLD